MPLCFGASGSVRASRKMKSASCACVVQTFWPLMTHSSPSSTAVVLSDARSEPEFGSLKPWHHAISPLRIFGRKSCFCSSVPHCEDRRADERVAEEVGAHRRAGACELLVQHDVVHDREALAAVLLRPGRADPPALVELVHPLLVEALSLVALQLEALVEPTVGEVLLQPGADLLAERFGLGRIGQIHDRHS